MKIAGFWWYKSNNKIIIMANNTPLIEAINFTLNLSPLWLPEKPDINHCLQSELEKYISLATMQEKLLTAQKDYYDKTEPQIKYFAATWTHRHGDGVHIFKSAQEHCGYYGEEASTPEELEALKPLIEKLGIDVEFNEGETLEIEETENPENYPII